MPCDPTDPVTAPPPSRPTPRLLCPWRRTLPFSHLACPGPHAAPSLRTAKLTTSARCRQPPPPPSARLPPAAGHTPLLPPRLCRSPPPLEQGWSGCCPVRPSPLRPWGHSLYRVCSRGCVPPVSVTRPHQPVGTHEVPRDNDRDAGCSHPEMQEDRQGAQTQPYREGVVREGFLQAPTGPSDNSVLVPREHRQAA